MPRAREIGTLRHMVTLENPSTPAPGSYDQTWTALVSQMPASIDPATARDLERVTSGTVMSTATHVVTMRYVAGVTTQTRLLFGTRTFQVTGVSNPEERNVELILTCVEVVT